MAEQNILTGDLAVLDQIIGDLKEHRKNKEQLEKLNEIAKDLTKNIENDERELKEEIDGRKKAPHPYVRDMIKLFTAKSLN